MPNKPMIAMDNTDPEIEQTMGGARITGQAMDENTVTFTR